MKKCYECGTEMPDDLMVCPKCGAPQTKKEPLITPNYVNIPPSTSNVLDSPFFDLIPFISAVLFTLGAFVLLITSIKIEVYIFASIIFFLASIANLVSALPKFIQQVTKK